MTALLVFAGAATGAVLRYLTTRLLRGDSPRAVLLVNVVGSFALGWVAGSSPALTALVGTGLCGGLTTYSTFSHDTVTLVERGEHRKALANVAANLVLGVSAAALGHVLGHRP
ncbi:fluoride efflux transporter FluC [Saccharothrix yanglingensis]|uniref:Fluoride-specific ion channel FluC n=1 Tax=Saccharothrix yanglingensis TaxID=659496 RepID=A0ABU0X151_9PSEU|nr:CrcB family protein [Saccharothrix yanglingensis]MDQ2585853.1 fluoride efflux transporter CrcB [Saccharothrix yanglingensis]